ncbi:MAG: TonB-dependent receptor [Methylococcales bacterium]
MSPKTQITAELEYNHKHQGQNMSAIPWVNGGLLSIPRNQTYGEYSPEIVDTIFGSLNWSHQFNDDWQIKHKFSVNQTSDNFLHFANANSYSGGSTISRYNVGLNSQYDTYSTNLDLTGHFDTWKFKHTLLIGGDYYRTNNNSGYGAGIKISSLAWDLSAINVFNPVHPGTLYTQPIANYLQINNQTDQYGVYIQDQIKLPFDVHVMGGIRYQNFHQVTDSSMPSWFYGGSQDSTGQSQDAVTPRVGLLWKAQNWLSLYTNYSESFGMNQGLLFPGKTPPPTSAEQYEGGIKTEFFNSRLRANLAYYDLTKTNVMTTDMAHLGFSIATGAVRSRGPELDITGEILPGWTAILIMALIL